MLGNWTSKLGQTSVWLALSTILDNYDHHVDSFNHRRHLARVFLIKNIHQFQELLSPPPSKKKLPPKTCPVSFQCHRLVTVIYRKLQEPTVRCKLHAEGPPLKKCCTDESDWMCYLMFSWYGSVYSTETHFVCLKSMRIPMFTSANLHLKFVHSQCVMSSENRGTPAWIKAKAVSSSWSQWETYWPVQARIYHTCVELAIFVGRTVCDWNSTFKHTAWSTTLSPSRWSPLGCNSINTICLPKKCGTHIFATGGGRAIAILGIKIAWWHGSNADLFLLIQALICF